MSLWSVTWCDIWIGLTRADDAAEAIRLMQARNPHIDGGEWTANEVIGESDHDTRAE
jgi:hypothetical protein